MLLHILTICNSYFLSLCKFCVLYIAFLFSSTKQERKNFMHC